MYCQISTSQERALVTDPSQDRHVAFALALGGPTGNVGDGRLVELRRDRRTTHLLGDLELDTVEQ